MAITARSSSFPTAPGNGADRANGPLLPPIIRRSQAGSGSRPIEEGAVALFPRGTSSASSATRSLSTARLPDHLALVACDGATTGPWRPRPPVGVRLIVIDHLHCSSHPDLTVRWQEPMEQGRGKWIRPQLPALVAFVVGIEDESSVIDASEQHHSGGRAPIGRGCGNCHRLGHGLAGRSGNLEPPGKLGHRIGIDGCFVHGHSLLARASRSGSRRRSVAAVGQDHRDCAPEDPTVRQSTAW